MSDCYIYAYEIDGIVRYIGRGRSRRIFHHLAAVRKRAIKKANGEALRPHRFYDRLARAIQSGATIVGRKIRVGLTGDQAIVLEMEEIRKYPPDELWNTIVTSTPKIADADWRARQSASAKRIMADPDRRRRIAAKMKAINEDPAVRERKAEAMRAAWANTDQREQRVQSLRKSLQNSDYQDRLRAATKANWNDPEIRAKRLSGMASALERPELRAKWSAGQKARLSGSPSIGRAWWAVEGRIELLVQLREAGKTQTYIAERLGTNQGRVSGMLRRLGIRPL